MSTPKTRIPVVARHHVRLALECWRDYLLAISNENGASLAEDVARILGIKLNAMNRENRFNYQDRRLKDLVKNVEKYGAR